MQRHLKTPFVTAFMSMATLIGCEHIEPVPHALNTPSVSTTASNSSSVDDCIQGITVGGSFNLFGIQNLPITLRPGATIEGAGENAYITSTVTILVESENATLFFPVGDEEGYRPVELEIKQSTAELTAYTVEVINDPAPEQDQLTPPLKRVSDQRYWRIYKCGGAELEEAHVTINYGEDDGVTKTETLRLAHYQGDAWKSVGKQGSGLSQDGGGTISTDEPITDLSQPSLFTLAGIQRGRQSNLNN